MDRNSTTTINPAEEVETIVVDRPTYAPQQPVGVMQLPTDPISLILFGPLIMFMNSMMMMQRSMMGMPGGGMGMYRGSMGGGYKIVELRRDRDGNIISIMEKW